MEASVELLLSIIDFSCYLYFFKKIIQEDFSFKLAITSTFLFTLLQYGKESIFMFSPISSILDSVISVSYLLMNAKNKNFRSFTSAVIIDVIFTMSILTFISVSVEVGVDVDATLTFGYARFLFACAMKLFTICVFILLKKPLLHLCDSMNDQIGNFVLLLIGILLLLLAYTIGNVKGNVSIFVFVIVLIIIAILIYYVLYRYITLLNKQSEDKIIQHSIHLTENYVKRLEKEHDEIRKIRHDISNQLQTMNILLQNKEYALAQQNLDDIASNLVKDKVSISGNTYIDAILELKMKEYEHIDFDLDVIVTKDFRMNGTDIISLLSNIIDNACEELNRIKKQEFKLSIKGNAKQLVIIGRNVCRENIELQTDKSKKNHGYGLKIIKQITEKYNGSVKIKNQDNSFEISVLLLFS